MPQKKMELPAVLFDLDGTLIDSVYEHVFAWPETLHEARINVPKWKIHRRVWMSGKSFIQELLRELNLKTQQDRSLGTGLGCFSSAADAHSQINPFG